MIDKTREYFKYRNKEKTPSKKSIKLANSIKNKYKAVIKALAKT